MDENDVEKVSRIILEVQIESDNERRAEFVSELYHFIMAFLTFTVSCVLIGFGYLWVLKYIGAGLFAILLLLLYVRHKREKAERKKTAYWP